MSDKNKVNQTLHQELESQGFKPFLTLALRKELSIKEQRSKYVASLGAPRMSSAFQVDGKIITSGSKCDFLVLAESADKNGWVQVLVELKGSDIHHAIEQLEATLKTKRFSHSSISSYNARVVGRSYPSSNSDPTRRKASIRFKRNYGCDLKFLSSGNPDKI